MKRVFRARELCEKKKGAVRVRDTSLCARENQQQKWNRFCRFRASEYSFRVREPHFRVR
jgi:hypothetical protein